MVYNEKARDPSGFILWRERRAAPKSDLYKSFDLLSEILRWSSARFPIEYHMYECEDFLAVYITGFLLVKGTVFRYFPWEEPGLQGPLCAK